MQEFPRDNFSLSGQQQRLYDELARKDRQLAIIYYGALKVLADRENEDRFALASHGIRELMEKLPRYLDVPIENKSKVTLKEKVQNLADNWKSFLKHPQWSNINNNERIEGEIDAPLANFLKKTKKFFDWFEQERPTRRKETAKMIQNLDPLRRKLPQQIENAKTQDWDRLKDYFVNLCHHRFNTSDDDGFDKNLLALEQFILDLAKPKTFEDFSEIDAIIQEGENDAES